MGVHAAERDTKAAHLVGDEIVERGECLARRACEFVVSEEDDPDVAWVVVFDMCTLVDEWSCLPDASGRVDRVVLSDVGPVVPEMSSADRGQSADRLGVLTRWERTDRVVVDSDSGDALHRISEACFGFASRPLRAWDHEVGELCETRAADRGGPYGWRSPVWSGGGEDRVFWDRLTDHIFGV